MSKRMLSLKYLGADNDFNREMDSFLVSDTEEKVPRLSSEFGTRKPKGHDFQIEIYFSGHSKTHAAYSSVADWIFADDMLSEVMSTFDLSRLNTINHYRLDPKRSYDRIDRAIHRVGKDAIKHIQKFFKLRPNPLRSNAPSTVDKKGFDQYGTETGRMMSLLRYRVKYIGSKTFR